MTREILERVAAQDLWIDDHSICATGMVYGMPLRNGFIFTRQHATILRWEPLGTPIDTGRGDTGTMSEQRLAVSDEQAGC